MLGQELIKKLLRLIRPERGNKLSKCIGKKITVEYYSYLETHRADDAPSFPQVNKHKKTGVLTEIKSGEIVVGGESMPFFERDDMMERGSGVPVGASYITTGSGISLIRCGRRVLYKNTVYGEQN